VLGPLERANYSHCPVIEVSSPPSSEDGNRSSFRNTEFKKRGKAMTVTDRGGP
jgi:hypothetical protein